MYAERIMNSDLPAVKPEDSAGRVLHLMDEYKVRHLPLVNGDEFSGLIYEDDLMDLDEETPMAAAASIWASSVPVNRLTRMPAACSDWTVSRRRSRCWMTSHP